MFSMKKSLSSFPAYYAAAMSLMFFVNIWLGLNMWCLLLFRPRLAPRLVFSGRYTQHRERFILYKAILSQVKCCQLRTTQTFCHRYLREISHALVGHPFVTLITLSLFTWTRALDPSSGKTAYCNSDYQQSSDNSFSRPVHPADRYCYTNCSSKFRQPLFGHRRLSDNFVRRRIQGLDLTAHIIVALLSVVTIVIVRQFCLKMGPGLQADSLRLSLSNSHHSRQPLYAVSEYHFLSWHCMLIKHI